MKTPTINGQTLVTGVGSYP